MIQTHCPFVHSCVLFVAVHWHTLATTVREMEMCACMAEYVCR